MFRSVVICPEQSVSSRLIAALETTGHVAVMRRLDTYPSALDLIRTLRVHTPELVFLSFDSLDKASDLVSVIQAEASRVQIVAIGRNTGGGLYRELMRMGIRETVTDPFDQKELMECLAHIKALLDKQPARFEATDQIISFVPSKPGVGTSTIALNVAAAMASFDDTSVLLSDFDLGSGMLRFMLKLNAAHSVTDALDNATKLDENLWTDLVSTVAGVDVLHAGRPKPHPRTDADRIRSFVGFARRNYKALCFDHSGSLEEHSIELMLESRRILLVCTPEVCSLHLAREKLAFMKELDLGSRVWIVLNRADRRSLISPKQVEEMLGIPVACTLPNRYSLVSQAVTRGALVETASDLGQTYLLLASRLMERPLPHPAAPKRSLLEFLAGSPSHSEAPAER